MNVYRNTPDYIPDHFPATGAEFEDTPDHIYTTRELERTIRLSSWVIKSIYNININVYYSSTM